MRWLVLALLIGCGGKVVGDGADAARSDGGSNPNDPLGGGGMLKKGPCIFTPAFMPHGMPPIANPPVMGIGVSSGTPMNFSIACSGTAADTFYYATEMDGLNAMVGTQTIMATMKQTTNGREGEAAAGPCTVTIATVSSDKKVSGTFQCNLIDDPIGTFIITGKFDAIPL